MIRFVIFYIFVTKFCCNIIKTNPITYMYVCQLSFFRFLKECVFFDYTKKNKINNILKKIK